MAKFTQSAKMFSLSRVPQAKLPHQGVEGPAFFDAPKKFTQNVRDFRFRPEEVEPEETMQVFDDFLKEDFAKDERGRFMAGEWVSWKSSHCMGGRYIAEQLYMELEYHDGSYYGYFNVSPQEAGQMFDVGSHGGWVWEKLRIKGTKLGYRKEYVYLNAVSSSTRQWDRSPETAAAHGVEADMQTRAALSDQEYATLKGKF